MFKSESCHWVHAEELTFRMPCCSVEIHENICAPFHCYVLPCSLESFMRLGAYQRSDIAENIHALCASWTIAPSSRQSNRTAQLGVLSSSIWRMFLAFTTCFWHVAKKKHEKKNNTCPNSFKAIDCATGSLCAVFTTQFFDQKQRRFVTQYSVNIIHNTEASA